MIGHGRDTKTRAGWTESKKARVARMYPLRPRARLHAQGKDWLHEPKWDGFRFQIIKDGDNVRFYFCHGAEYGDRLPRMREALQELQALGEVGRAVNSTLDLKVVLKTIVDRAVELSGTDAGSIYYYRQELGNAAAR
jgi:ATP-dependent DNA ligase